MTTKLGKLAEKNKEVRDLLLSKTSSDDVSLLLKKNGFDHSSRTVRRTRQEMGVSQTYAPEVMFQEPETFLDTENCFIALVLPDWQCDLQDDDFLWRVHQLALDLGPDLIVHVGDENDASSISRWTQGTPEEHIPDQLQRQVDTTYQWMKRFREIPTVRQFDVCYSNHGHRFGQSMRSRLPGWKDMRVVQYEHIMREAAWYHGDEELDINWDVHVVDSIPGTIAGHGDQWNLTSKAQYSQLTNVAMENAKNVIAGHTHRPMLSTVPYRDENGDQQSRFIMNVGHAMDITQADYTSHYRGKTPTWGQAVGIITVVDGVAHPQLVQDHRGSMLFSGRVY